MGSWFAQIPLQGKFDQPGDVMDAKFAHQINAVGINCFGIQPEARADFLRSGALDQQTEDFVFARAQSSQWVVRDGSLPGAEQVGQPQRRRDVNLPIQNPLEGFGQLLSGSGFKPANWIGEAKRVSRY
jgi:hypothetical protein